VARGEQIRIPPEDLKHELRSGGAIQVGFELLDPILDAWADRHVLHIFTKNRDDDIRSTRVVGPTGKMVQIWIEVHGDVIRVHASDNVRLNRGGFHDVFTGGLGTLPRNLDNAYQRACLAVQVLDGKTG
jgi:hypothetical protein